MNAELTIGSRFCGPPGSGNGGYTSGRLAELVVADVSRPVVEVTLRHPPPLDVAMRVEQVAADDPANVTGGPTTVLLMGGAKIAEARVVADHLDPVAPVSIGQASEAMGRFPGLVVHPFPTCFSCGPDRDEDDGLRIFPGRVADHTMASLWVPGQNLAEPPDLLAPDRHGVGLGATWAALDCVGGWAGDMEERRMVLGRMTAQVDAMPVAGEPHVVVGTATGTQGRKTFTASTLYDGDGRIVARAQHVWIAVDPTRF